jgi:3-oxoadipate enol-lactonase
LGIWHEESGEGPPVLFIHAGICDHRMWEPQWRSFATSHRVVRCDLPGFGRTPIQTNHRYSHAGDIIDVIETLELRDPTIVGCSAGALVGLEVALARPDLAGALVLADSPMDDHEWSDEVRSYQAAEDAALERGDLDEATELNVRMWVDRPSRRSPLDPAISALVAEMQRKVFELQLAAGDEDEGFRLVEDVGGRLGEVTVPTLVLVGDEDVADMQVIAERLASEIPGARKATIAGAAHLPNLERPGEFDEVVLPFCDSPA